MAIFKEITSQDIKTSRSYLHQLVDIVQEDVSGSESRRSYPVFVTGGIGPGVTSSLFQTVYDQNYNLQIANPIFDFTVGLYYSGSTVQNTKTGEDSNGKLLFPSNSLMMREKIDIYKQFAQNLLGNSDSFFSAPYAATGSGDIINEALFVCFKRLFSRDSIKRETFAMKFHEIAAVTIKDSSSFPNFSNLYRATTSGSSIYTDIGSTVNRLTSFGGNVGNIVNAANTSRYVGNIFYDQGIAVFDLSKIVDPVQRMTGVIDAMNANNPSAEGTGKMILAASSSGNIHAKFIPDFMVSGSIDNILNHIGSVRVGSSSATSITFQNATNINSTLIFCRATSDEFNYSSNPSYRDADGRIVVIDEGQEGKQLAFSFITTVGLYDANDNLLAVAKVSRPIEKNPEKDLTLRLRLDF